MKKKLKELQAVCQAAGLRMTHQRMEIYSEVAKTTEHPAADTIFQRVRERLPTISHDTVYRTLASLEELKLISRLDPTCGRARYDANCDLHHHFICSQCKNISDLYFDEEPTLPTGLDELGEAQSVHVKIYGICHQCNTTNKKEGAHHA